MRLLDRIRRRGEEGPAGITVKVRAHNRPGVERTVQRRWMPHLLTMAVVLSSVFYLLAHYAIVDGIWPAHGTAPGAGGVLVRDLFAMLGWLLLLIALRAMGYRGSWAVVALPVVIFFLTRPSLFQLFSDPVYQATAGTRAEANALKAERSQLTTILRAYDEERQERVFRGNVPEIPDPITAIRNATRPERRSFGRVFSAFSVILAPAALLLAFWWSRKPSGGLRWVRDRRLIPFVPVIGAFLVLAALPSVRATGKFLGTTPWELFLPVFVGVWAATLADDAYNLARPGEIFTKRRVILRALLFGALPLVPLLAIRELGLTIVTAGALATMLLVGTRRGWWAGLMLVVWAAFVVVVFSIDERSQTRLALATDPYRDYSGMSEPEAEAWGAKVHQIKLFDANVLEGGLFGDGAGRGHAETAPNSADDGFITTIAAQWGLLGALGFIFLYTAFLIQMLAVAVRERGAFERSLVTGLAMLIAIPFWLAVLGGIRVIPLTGVAAAFAAHGGAKLLASSLAVGIIAGISHRRADEERLAEVDRPAGDLSDQGIRVR